MDDKLYAQFNAEGICTCVGTPNITGVEADYTKLGMLYVDGVWKDVPRPVEPIQPTNAEVAQMISDLQADLIIAGVI